MTESTRHEAIYIIVKDGLLLEHRHRTIWLLPNMFNNLEQLHHHLVTNFLGHANILSAVVYQNTTNNPLNNLNELLPNSVLRIIIEKT